MAVLAFSPSALWSQLVSVWKPHLFWDPSQKTSTSNKYCDKTSFNLNKQTKLSSSRFDLYSGIGDKEEPTKGSWAREAGVALRPGF